MPLNCTPNVTKISLMLYTFYHKQEQQNFLTLPFSPFSPKIFVKVISIPLPCSSIETFSEKSLIPFTSPSSMVTFKSHLLYSTIISDRDPKVLFPPWPPSPLSPTTPLFKNLPLLCPVAPGFCSQSPYFTTLLKAIPATLLVLTVPSMPNFQQGEISLFPSTVVLESGSKYIFFLILIPIQSSWNMNYLFFPQLDLWFQKTRTKSFHLN